MKLPYCILVLGLFALIGCATERMPAGEIHKAQTQETEQQRYIYGGASFARE